jgi:hypothetical protein
MAITYVSGTGATGATISSFAVTYPGGYVLQTGDIAVVVCEVNANADTFSQAAGPTYTGLGAAGAIQTDSSGAVLYSTMVAWRMLDTGDIAPTFSCPTANRGGWVIAILRPDINYASAIDATAGPTFGVAGTSFTPPSATAAWNTDASVIILSAKASASGTTAITWTAPGSWTSQVVGGLAGGASTASNFIGIATRIPVGTGAVTPGAATTNVSCLAGSASYQLLIKEQAGGKSLLAGQAVKRASLW